ncbi:MAG: hypothetical protein JJE39_17915 [Vicinamibacteria bacterium]|nr:hypothetical protein [Vicinamibacteria bacterium]
MRRLPKIPTLLALLGLLLPWGRVVAVSAHLSIEDHEASAADHVADLEESFHGHRHTEGRPNHQHPWIGVDLVAQRAKVTRAITAPALVHLAAISTASAGVGAVVRGRATALNDHGPPGARSRRAILRI